MSATSNSSARSASSKRLPIRPILPWSITPATGFEISGVNYLIPVDARLASDRDSEDEAIPLERLVASADGAKRLRLIVLDACRDNPFVKSMRRERKTASRAVSAGPRQGRADQHRYADCLCCEGRLDGR
jgi:uncharacterized caspase-like protein